jgi:8-oxo-dGTP pyrophosphatase MutT (NUDIX family)
MPTVDGLRAALAAPPRPLDPAPPRSAGVAALLTPELDLLLIRRAERPGDPWSGHLGFPGGHAEPGDASLLHTAVRETREELGLDLEHAELLGPLQPLPTAGHLPSLGVYPFVFALDRTPRLSPNYEVAGVHFVPLEALLTNRDRRAFEHDWRGQKVKLPMVEVEGHRLWGLTLLMVDDLLHRLDGGGVGLARVADLGSPPKPGPH